MERGVRTRVHCPHVVPFLQLTQADTVVNVSVLYCPVRAHSHTRPLRTARLLRFPTEQPEASDVL